MGMMLDFTTKLAAAAAILGAVIALPSDVHSQTHESVLFQTEVITITVTTGTVSVRGQYTFANVSSFPRFVTLFYPFPVDSLHPFPSHIAAVSGTDSVPFKRGRNGIYFAARLPREGSVRVDVSYDQPCLVPNACYILRTTAYWRVPLDEARFEVRVPPGIELRSMSYPADEVLADRDTLVCKFTRKDFMPVTDLCLEWQAKKDDAE